MSENTGGRRSENTDDNRLLTIVLITLAVLVLFPLFFMGFGMMGFHSMGGMWGSSLWVDGTISGWMIVFAAVMRLLFLALIIGAGYLVFRAITGTDGDSDRALEELRLAYARGDLDDEEYEQRREALERNS